MGREARNTNRESKKQHAENGDAFNRRTTHPFGEMRRRGKAPKKRMNEGGRELRGHGGDGEWRGEEPPSPIGLNTPICPIPFHKSSFPTASILQHHVWTCLVCIFGGFAAFGAMSK
jgi:hypothetical protein